MHDLLRPLSGLIGVWQGEGTGIYPTIEPFGYREELTVQDVPDKPILRWSTTTWGLGLDGRAMHGEQGYLRAGPDGSVELLAAHTSGILELATGSIVNGLLRLTSDVVVPSGTAKEVTTLVRRYEVEHNAISYELGMSAVAQPLQEHLKGRLERVPAPARVAPQAECHAALTRRDQARGPRVLYPSLRCARGRHGSAVGGWPGSASPPPPSPRSGSRCRATRPAVGCRRKTSTSTSRSAPQPTSARTASSPS